MTTNLGLIDLLVLVFSIGGIALYGMWAARARESATEFLSGNKQSNWWAMAMGIIATQASAITFISTPGQGFWRRTALRSILFGNASGIFSAGNLGGSEVHEKRSKNRLRVP
jgi:Na+/proline symporter